MRYIFLILCTILINSAASADRVVFEQKHQKEWLDYSVMAVEYDIALIDRVGVVVHLSNEPSQPEYVINYDDYLPIPNLLFNNNLGKHGALVYSEKSGQTVCAYKGVFATFKDTGACKIDVDDRDQYYTIRLSLKN